MAKTILVTGSNGQLGNELRVISNEFQSTKFLFTDIDELDITSKDAISTFFKAEKPDLCINCAAYTAVDLAEDEEEKAFLINKKAVEHLAMCCADYHATLYHISTDFVFDGRSWLPYTEEDQPNPISVYGKSKLAGEQKAVSINPKTTIIRTSWLYSTFGKNFVKTMIHLGSTRDELGVVFDQVGTPTNSRDLAAVLKDMVNQDFEAETENKVIHFSNEGVASWYDFAHEIFSIKKLNVKLRPLRSEEFPMKAKRPNYSVLDKTGLKKSLGVSISHWRDSLGDCLKDL